MSINKYDKREKIHVRRAVEIREQLTGGDPPVAVMPAVVPRWIMVMRTIDVGAVVAEVNHPRIGVAGPMGGLLNQPSTGC